MSRVSERRKGGGGRRKGEKEKREEKGERRKERTIFPSVEGLEGRFRFRRM